MSLLSPKVAVISSAWRPWTHLVNVTVETGANDREQFIPLRDFDDVTSALNFYTPDIHVIGGCDLYTTKAAGSDKKLYRNIEHSLESQYESLLRLSASLSPPGQPPMAAPVNLSRSSPFGPLSQISSRRTFAYLIATLNASHPDYDFSHVLRPADFRQEKSLKSVINTIDSTLYNVRPSTGTSLQVPSQTTYATTASPAATSQAWGPRMWALIDNEMSLKDCTIYCYSPDEDPMDGEEGAIWSLNYFFFNKEKKRVTYIYVRGVPVINHSPRLTATMAKRGASGVGNSSGANKRARYWLGDRADGIAFSGSKLDDDEFGLDDEEDFDGDDLQALYGDDEFCDDYDDDADDESDEQEYRGYVRGVSEDIAASMEIEV